MQRPIGLNRFTLGLFMFSVGPMNAGDVSRSFRRGDANTDGRVDISDSTRMFGWLF